MMSLLMKLSKNWSNYHMNFVQDVRARALDLGCEE